MNNGYWAVTRHPVQIIAIGVAPLSEQRIVVTMPYDPAIRTCLREAG